MILNSSINNRNALVGGNYTMGMYPLDGSPVYRHITHRSMGQTTTLSASSSSGRQSFRSGSYGITTYTQAHTNKRTAVSLKQKFIVSFRKLNKTLYYRI